MIYVKAGVFGCGGSFDVRPEIAPRDGARRGWKRARRREGEILVHVRRVTAGSSTGVDVGQERGVKV